MPKITKYTKRDGSTAYMFKLYFGKDKSTGKRLQTTRRGFKTKKLARLTMDKLELEFENKKISTSKNATFQDIYNDYFPKYKNTVKESTWCKTQQNYKNHVLPIFGSTQLKKITVQQCQTAVDKWFGQKLTKYKEFIHLVSAIFQYAIRLDIVHDDPTKRVLLPKFQPSKDNTLNYFNKIELREFFDRLDEQKYPKRATFFRLIAFTGMRKGEAIALTWKDIDLKNNQITINKTIARGEDAKLIVQSPKTRASNRTIDVDPRTISILKDWKKIQSKELSELGFKVKSDKNQLVFTNTKDGYLQPCYPQKWLKKVIDKYDMKNITVHGLRHTYATLAFEASASVKEVQEQLGHAEYKTTMDIYTAVTPKQKLETSKKFSNYVDF